MGKSKDDKPRHLQGGTHDWISDSAADASADSDNQGAADTPEQAEKTRSGDGASEGPDSLRDRVADGYMRRTLLMREDHVERLDRLAALERASYGQQEARTKKDMTEQAWDLFFESDLAELPDEFT